MHVIDQCRILKELFGLFSNTGLHQSKCSPRTNLQGISGQTCAGEAAKTPSIFFVNLPPHTVWIRQITGFVLKTDQVKCLDTPPHPKFGFFWMNRHHDVVSGTFFLAHLECTLSLFLWDDMLSVQLPPATREPANVRPIQPTSADVP